MGAECDALTEKLNLKFSCILAKGAQIIEEADIFSYNEQTRMIGATATYAILGYTNKYSSHERANVKTTVQQFNMRLEPDVITKLGRLSEQSGLGRAQVVKRLIREASESTSLPQFLKGGGDD